jgi:hypothetical protein
MRPREDYLRVRSVACGSDEDVHSVRGSVSTAGEKVRAQDNRDNGIGIVTDKHNDLVIVSVGVGKVSRVERRRVSDIDALRFVLEDEGEGDWVTCSQVEHRSAAGRAVGGRGTTDLGENISIGRFRRVPMTGSPKEDGKLRKRSGHGEDKRELRYGRASSKPVPMQEVFKLLDTFASSTVRNRRL